MSIQINVTFSASTYAITIPSTVSDTIELHYGCCDYCSRDMRFDKIVPHSTPRRFCSDKERALYSFHRIGEAS